MTAARAFLLCAILAYALGVLRQLLGLPLFVSAHSGQRVVLHHDVHPLVFAERF